MAHSAVYYKKCCGTAAYDIAAIKEFCSLKPDIFDIYIDEELKHPNLRTTFVMGFNVKTGGGGMVLNPYAVMNDGLMDLLVVPRAINTS